CLGAVVVGDMLTGQETMLENSVGVIGHGFGAVYLMQDDQLYPVTQMLQDGNQVHFNVKMDSAVLNSIKASLFSNSWGANQVFTTTMTNAYDTFTIAACRTPNSDFDSS